MCWGGRTVINQIPQAANWQGFFFLWIPTDLLKGRNEELKPDHYLRKSPSLESLSKPPMAFSSRMLSSTPSCLKPQSKLRYQPSFLGKTGQTNSITWHQDKCFNLEDCVSRADSAGWSLGRNYQALLDPDVKIQIVMITVTCKMGNEDSKLSGATELYTGIPSCVHVVSPYYLSVILHVVS